MCRPNTIPNTTINNNGPREVVIAGAGPAGLLLTALLLQRNNELPSPLYKVTLLDNRQDLGALTQEELKKSFRSWMLALADHGVGALKECQGLYEEYCKNVGVELTSLSIHLGKKEIKNSATPEDVEGSENFIVDRNFIVAALARFVKDTNNNNLCTTLYEHKILYVDYENRRVLVRNIPSAQEFYLPYDLLVGCDGVRSTVREAMVKRHSTFEMDVGDIFQTFKAVHIELPKGVDASSMHLLPNIFPDFTGIALPETEGKINVSIGTSRHLFDSAPAELKSDDPKVVADYVKKTFQAFELVDYDDFARQWVQQRWNRTGQVHCNFYHSNEMNVVIMGDAAHATSPSIGMGMNTALRDAQVFYKLLQEKKDNLEEVLPTFSEKRVKEGNSLTDLAMNLYCMNPRQQLYETVHMIVRSALHKRMPSLVLEHPQNMIGRKQYTLSDVYDQATLLGIMGKHGRINHDIRQVFFERETGMVQPETHAKLLQGSWKKTAVWSAVAVAGVAVGYSQWIH